MMRREGDQVPVQPVTIEEIMSRPGFELGVADVRAGRPYRLDYDLWPETNDQWDYERGRQWATVTPSNVRLKFCGRVTVEALNWFVRSNDDIR
jgi:hypothetical protein